jgi:tight adherence protein C
MFQATDFLAFVIAFLILLFGFAFLSKLSRKDVFKDRMNHLMKYKERLAAGEEESKNIISKPDEQSHKTLRGWIEKIQRSSAGEQAKLTKLFEKAGLRTQNASFMYGLAKVIMTVPPALIVGLLLFTLTTWPLLIKIMLIIAAALLGSYLVDFILNQLVAMRQERIQKAFPEALDLMVICTEAGLSLSATVQRVAREIAQMSPDLGYELAVLSIELNMLPDRRRALRNFSDRLDSPNFKAIITNLTQAEQYGTPIAQSMRIIAEEFRADRLFKAEEQAAKLPVKLTLPTMLFIFPSLYVVILGPAIINVMQTFK